MSKTAMPKAKKSSSSLAASKRVPSLTADERRVLAASARASRRKNDPLVEARVRLISLALDDPTLTSVKLQEDAWKGLVRDLRRIIRLSAGNDRLQLLLLKKYERLKRRSKNSKPKGART